MEYTSSTGGSWCRELGANLKSRQKEIQQRWQMDKENKVEEGDCEGREKNKSIL